MMLSLGCSDVRPYLFLTSYANFETVAMTIHRDNKKWTIYHGIMELVHDVML